MHVKFGGKVRGRVAYLISIHECNVQRRAGACVPAVVLETRTEKSFTQFQYFNSPRESTQLHKSSNPDAHVCGDATPRKPLYRCGRPDSTPPKIDTKTSLEPRFNLNEKKNHFPRHALWSLVFFLFFFKIFFLLCYKLAIAVKKIPKTKDIVLTTRPSSTRIFYRLVV